MKEGNSHKPKGVGMNHSSAEQETIETYDKYADTWSRFYNTRGGWNKEMDAFQKYLPKGRILEIGSGGGRDAADLLERGYQVVGTDVSSGLIAQARKNVPGVKFYKQSVYHLNFPKKSFSGFWCSATLLHVPKAKIDEALQSIHRCIRNGGVGFISLKQGRGERLVVEKEPGHEWRRLFSFYTLSEFHRVVGRNNLTILEEKTKVIKRIAWLTYIVRVS